MRSLHVLTGLAFLSTSSVRADPGATLGAQSKDYCMLDGVRTELDLSREDPLPPNVEANAKCWKGGALVVDILVTAGKRNGYITAFDEHGSRRMTYQANKVVKLEKTSQDGTLRTVISLVDNEPVGQSKYGANGRLIERRNKTAEGWAHVKLDESGRVSWLLCFPSVRNDPELRALCGFERPRTTPIYNGDKLVRTETWNAGVLEKREARDAAGRTVAFVEGKKHGEEREVDSNSKLSMVTHWNHGVKEGTETEYADGEKIVKETVFRAGKPVKIIENYLNGQRKLQVSFLSEDEKQEATFWDTGKTQRDGRFVRCRPGYPGWCAEGTHRSYYEDGTPESDESWQRGTLEGPSKHWYPDGKQARIEAWVSGRIASVKRWNEHGDLIADDELEADGSRKLRR